MEKELTKESFFNNNIILFKFISLALNNVILEDQLKEVLRLTGVCKDENEFKDFIAKCKKFQLLKEVDKNDSIGSKTTYVARNHVVQNVALKVFGKNISQYTYSQVDAKISYYKMFYVLETIQYRSHIKHGIHSLEKLFLDLATLDVGKSKYLELYKRLEQKGLLNINGEIMCNDLRYYEVQKLLNLKNKEDDSKKIKAVESLLQDSVYAERFYEAIERLQGNDNFWCYNLGKISDNKSYFVFYNPYISEGYRVGDREVNIVKFDISKKFTNAKIGEYIARMMESIKANIKEEYNVVNLDIYFSNEKTKDKTFIDCVNRKTGRHGVKNLDSNLTARIKEVARKEYSVRIMNFSEPIIDHDKYMVSYKIYYNSKATDSDKFYTLNLRFKHTDFDEYTYNEEEQERIKREKELAKKEKELDRIFHDEDYLYLMKEFLKKKGVL